MPAQPRPDILFFMADQFRWDCLGCMGNTAIRTPNLDAIAARGVVFRNAFTPDPICVPARATIMTGNYPTTCTGFRNNSGRIREGQPLLTEVLGRAGYRSYASGKLHFVPYAPPGTPRLVHGFEHVDLHESGRVLAEFDPEGRLRGVEDYFDYLRDAGWGGYGRGHGIGNNDVRPCPSPLPAEHHVDRWIADCAIRRLDAHVRESPERPFFLFVSSPKPHSPYDPPRPFDSLYDPRALPKPFGTPADSLTRDPHLEVERFTRAMGSLSPEAIQVIRSYYYGCITFLDEQVGRVVNRLRELGRLDNTIILFTADHGDLLGDFGTFFKVSHLNGSIRVPLLMAGPGIARGVVTEALAGLQDILPTLSAAAGTTIGQRVHGLELSAPLAGSRAPLREAYYAQTGSAGHGSWMTCDHRWKYIYSQWGAVEELYDQASDPHEERNLAADPAMLPLLRALRRRLRGQAEEFGDTDWLTPDGFAATPLDREAIRMLPIKGMGWRWY